jgi:hypothetical protein
LTLLLFWANFSEKNRNPFAIRLDREGLFSVVCAGGSQAAGVVKGPPANERRGRQAVYA